LLAGWLAACPLADLARQGRGRERVHKFAPGSRSEVRKQVRRTICRSSAAMLLGFGAQHINHLECIIREGSNGGKTTPANGGVLAARLPELDLDAVADPRALQGRWSLAQILRATLMGILGGCHSLWETEQRAERLSTPMRRQLGLPRRVPDASARDTLCRVSLDEIRGRLHQQYVCELHARRQLSGPQGYAARDAAERLPQSVRPELGGHLQAV